MDTIQRLLAICRHTIYTWLRHPSLIAAALIPPFLFLLIEALAAAAVAHSPVALVNLDPGPKGRQMQQIFSQSDVFRLTDATQQQARELLDSMQVAAIITIPADFTQRVGAHQADPIDVEVNNLNLDFTNDIRRSVPDAITQFYAAQGSGSPIQVTMHERDVRKLDIELFQYEVVPTLLLVVLVGGLVNAAVSTAREYERKTMKELLLSPASNTEIVLGKILAFFLIALGAGVVELGIGAALGWTRPSAWEYWLKDLLIIACVALFAASVGLVIGAGVQRIQSAHATATIFSLYLFFLAGGVGVLAFEPLWLQNIGSVVPLTYANHALQMATFYRSSDQFGRDVAVLVMSSLPPLLLALLLVRRRGRA